MKNKWIGQVSGTALVVAVAGGWSHSEAVAASIPCTGVFAHCATAVGGKCEVENGKVTMWYVDREGSSSRFEECVGKVYEANGKLNPYRPAKQKPSPTR